MGSAWKAGSTRAWRTTRAMVLARDRAANDPRTHQPWRCRAHDEGWCSRKPAGPHSCEGIMVHAHHTLGRARTGDDPRHIVGACETCNLAIGDPGTRTVVTPTVAVTDWG